MAPRILFILKYRDDAHGKGLSSGLLNSATFVVRMLEGAKRKFFLWF